MLKFRFTRRNAAVMCACGVLAVAAATNPTLIVLATDPCDSVINDPDPPVGPSVPEIGGTVTDVGGTNQPVQGATVNLFLCISGHAIQVDQATTTSQGHYTFTGMEDEHWYYVELLMIGALSGKALEGSTVNPTAPIGIGESVTDVDFSVE